MFKYVIENDLMPPWHLDPNTGPWKNDLSLTIKEKALLLQWIKSGSMKKKGKPQLLWINEKEKQNTSPDYIVRIPEKILIPSEGLIEYKRFIIQTNFREDKWIKSVKFLLKPKVIHHMWLFIMDKSFDPKNIYRARDYMITAFATIGDRREREKKSTGYLKSQNIDIGYKLPKESKLVLEIHYESIGKEVVDDFTKIHLNFFKKQPKYKTVTYTLANKKINIPPNESNYKLTTYYKLRKTRELFKINTHMHYRGKASSLFVIEPNGLRKRIFSIDPYIKTFERSYALKNLLTITEGSIIECVNWYDNSKKNPLNLNPNKYVKYGRFIKGEMSECYLTWRVTSDSDDRSLWIVNPNLQKKTK